MIVPRDLYHGTARLLRERLSRWGLRASFVDMTDLDAVRAAFTPAHPAGPGRDSLNPLLKITDIAAVPNWPVSMGPPASATTPGPPPSSRDAWSWARTWWSTPPPSTWAVTATLPAALWSAQGTAPLPEVRAIQQDGGAVPSPFDCWLLLRGIRTLPYRMRAHSGNAATVAAFLDGHPHVLRVFYPGVPDHDGHEVARRQMSMFGGMLSFRVRGGREAAFRVAARVSLFTRATSLGSYEASSSTGPPSKVRQRDPR